MGPLHSLIRMSLSKPFRLFDLPLLPLEQVLLLTEPKALFLFALSSEKARQLLRMFPLVKYFDIYVHDTSVIFWIFFKSGKPIKWEFIMKLPVNASEEGRRLANIELRDGGERTARLFKLDDMRMVLWGTAFEYPFEMRCNLPKEHFVDYTQRIGYFLQSICPEQRIRTLYAGNVGWKDEKVIFQMETITRCEKFCFNAYDGDNLMEFLEKTDVKREITLLCDPGDESNLEWMNNEKIRNISRLKLVHVRNLSDAQILSLDNEHLELVFCEVNESVVSEYLKKWMNGEFTKRRTLEITNKYGNVFYDTVLNGLTLEPVETWEKLGKPELVRFSYNFYLNPTPLTVPDEYQTVLLKNCHGQFATVAQTRREFFFTPWDHPLPPIKIPKGHKMCENSAWPFATIFCQDIEFPD